VDGNGLQHPVPDRCHHWRHCYRDRTSDRRELAQRYCCCWSVVLWYHSWRTRAKQDERSARYSGLLVFAPLRRVWTCYRPSLHSQYSCGMAVELLPGHHLCRNHVDTLYHLLPVSSVSEITPRHLLTHFHSPPRYAQLHVHGKTQWQQFKELDFGGLLLFFGGMVLFLVGCSWGGTVYPWVSGHVLGTLISGIFTLIGFGFYGKSQRNTVLEQPLIAYRAICRQR